MVQLTLLYIMFYLADTLHYMNELYSYTTLKNTERQIFKRIVHQKNLNCAISQFSSFQYVTKFSEISYTMTLNGIQCCLVLQSSCFVFCRRKMTQIWVNDIRINFE